jgi:hypothetical protein
MSAIDSKIRYTDKQEMKIFVALFIFGRIVMLVEDGLNFGILEESLYKIEINLVLHTKYKNDMVQVRLSSGEIRQFDSFADAWRFANDVRFQNIEKISIAGERWLVKHEIWNSWREQKVRNIGGPEYQNRGEDDIFLVHEDLGVMCDFIAEHMNEPKTEEYERGLDCVMIIEVLSSEEFANRYRLHVE